LQRALSIVLMADFQGRLVAGGLCVVTVEHHLDPATSEYI
jgi:hypothetical protein